jgi:TetR/AcrR family transcriptional regulator, regulator of mycofactocin system
MTPVEGRPRGRPAVSSAEEIEGQAIRLFLEEGFDETSMTEIAAVCGVGRTTLFRYFPSKADILWGAFDQHLRRLAQLLADQPEGFPLATTVQSAAVQAFGEAVDDRHVWRRRFAVLQQTDTLQPGLSIRWQEWARIVAQFVADRTGTHADDVIPAAVGGAVQAAFAATLRTWLRTGDFAPDVVMRMRDALQPVCDGMNRLLEDNPPRSHVAAHASRHGG